MNVIQILLENGANPNITTPYVLEPPLSWVVKGKEYFEAKYLPRLVPTRAVKPYFLMIFISTSKYMFQFYKVDSLIEHGADCKYKDAYGNNYLQVWKKV